MSKFKYTEFEQQMNNVLGIFFSLEPLLLHCQLVIQIATLRHDHRWESPKVILNGYPAASDILVPQVLKASLNSTAVNTIQ